MDYSNSLLDRLLPEQMLHGSGMLRLTTVPAGKVDAIAAIQDDKRVDTITAWVESVHRTIKKSKRYLCLGCGKNIGGQPAKASAYVFVEILPLNHIEYHAMCRRCGCSTDMVTKAVDRLIPSIAKDIAASPNVHLDGGSA